MTSSWCHVTFLKNTVPKMQWTWNLVSRYKVRRKFNEQVLADTWWRHHYVTWHLLKTHFLKWYEHKTWSVGTRWKGNSDEHVLAGTWGRHHGITWHFWKTYFLKCNEYESWPGAAKSKENSNEHMPAVRQWCHYDVTCHFWKTHFLKCYEYETC